VTATPCPPRRSNAIDTYAPVPLAEGVTIPAGATAALVAPHPTPPHARTSPRAAAAAWRWACSMARGAGVTARVARQCVHCSDNAEGVAYRTDLVPPEAPPRPPVRTPARPPVQRPPFGSLYLRARVS
jgi:hypothetical protein